MRPALLAGLSGLVAAGLIAAVGSSPTAAPAEADLRPVSAFEGIADERERSVALFQEMARVIEHPRCMNCHPRDDSPRQGMAMAMHEPPVVRGDGGFGTVNMRCSACHGVENVTYVGAAGSVPGHEPWHLAPASMGWIGLSTGEICAQLKDPERNGDRTLAEVHEHMAEDGLVGWGWHPGEGREPAPGTQAAFGALTAAWIEAGAHCPD